MLCLPLGMVLFMQSCKKDKPIGKVDWKCHEGEQLDSAQLAARMVGSWKWKILYCPWPNDTTTADKDVLVKFDSDGTYTLKENSSTRGNGTWKLTSSGQGFYLEGSISNSYLNGEIVSCENMLQFTMSYVDGCDHIFERQ